MKLVLLLLTKCPISPQRRPLLPPTSVTRQLSSTSSHSPREAHIIFLNQLPNEILTLIRTSSLQMPTVLTLSREADRNRTSTGIPLRILDCNKKALTSVFPDLQIGDQQLLLLISNQDLVVHTPPEALLQTDNTRIRKEVCRSILGQVLDLTNGVMINIEVMMDIEILETQTDIDHLQCRRTHMVTLDSKVTIGQDHKTGFDLHLRKTVLSETLDSKVEFARHRRTVHNLQMAVQGDQVEGHQEGHRAVHQAIGMDQHRLPRNLCQILMLCLIILLQ